MSVSQRTGNEINLFQVSSSDFRSERRKNQLLLFHFTLVFFFFFQEHGLPIWHFQTSTNHRLVEQIHRLIIPMM